MSHSTAGGSASGVLRQAKRQSRAHWAIYSRTRNWVRSPNRNPLFSQSPDCLFLKKSIKFLQSYEKTRAEQNKYIYFLCRVSVTSLIHQQSYEKKSEKQKKARVLSRRSTSLRGGNIQSHGRRGIFRGWLLFSCCSHIDEWLDSALYTIIYI